MKRRVVFAVVAALSGFAESEGWAQSGDPDRIERQEALGHASAIENAWRSVEARIGVTDAGDLWEDEWTGLSEPPAGDWWLQNWTDRGFTARYCDEVLAVYAADDELKGVGRDHRAVQVAPYTYGGGRTGLQLVLRGGRLYEGSRGREGGSLPGCMPIPSTTGDRVSLVVGVDDPKLTAVGVRWEDEDQTVACPRNPAVPLIDTGTFTERRRIPIQTTPVTDCPGSDPNCNDLIEFAGSPPAWPADCGARETMLSATPPELVPGAACTDWVRWDSNCQIVYAQAQPPAQIDPPSITWEDGPVHSWTTPCSCSCQLDQIVSGSCTRHWAQNTEWRVFVLRPGELPIRTRYPAAGRTASNLDGQPRLVNTVSSCSCTTPPPQTCPPGQVGTPPNCTTPPPSTCPPGQVGTPPNCTPAPPTCPPGQVGTPPNCTPVDPQVTSGTSACPAPWSGTATWTQQPGQSQVYDYTSCSQSGTGACPDGETGTATWTQSYGQQQSWDYSTCVPDVPVQETTTGSQACPSPWTGTATWTQEPGEGRVVDFSGCSQSGTASCPSGQTGTASWTQAFGQGRVYDYSVCTTPPPQEVTVPCPSGWSGTATGTLTENGWVTDLTSCWKTQEGPCQAGYTGNIVYTDYWPPGGMISDTSACVPVASGTGPCPAGWSGTATFTNVGNGPVYDNSACWQEVTSGCNAPYEGTSLWRRSWGDSWDDFTLVSHTCERPCYCSQEGEDGCVVWSGANCGSRPGTNNQNVDPGGPDGNDGNTNTQTETGVPEQDTVSDPNFSGQDQDGHGGDDGDDGGNSGSESGNGGSPP